MSITDTSGLFFLGIKMKKEYRLKDSDKIGLIVKKRQRIASQYYTIYYQQANDLKIAIVAGKKIGDAVTRNYNKRVIRNVELNRIINDAYHTYKPDNYYLYVFLLKYM